MWRIPTLRRSFVYALAAGLLIALQASSAAYATGGNTNGAPDPPEQMVPVTFGTTYGSGLYAADYSNGLGALPDSVSYGEYVVDVASPTTVAITVSDQSGTYVGDYFQLYRDADPGFSSPILVGTTPQVHTGSSLVAPSYSPTDTLWDGSGSTLSSQTFTVSVPAGKTYFVVVDALFRAMGAQLDTPCSTSTAALLSTGCHVSGANGVFVDGTFSPASYSITFDIVAAGVPEFGAGALLAVAAAVPFLLVLRRRRAGYPLSRLP